MKRKNYFSVLSIFLLSFLLLTFYGCGPSDKAITLSNSVQEDMKVTEKSILEALDEGNTLLAEEKFEDAKAAFEQAISFDKSNTNTYLEIKDKYLNLNRLDDAYYFIKLAIDNNVDNDNMIALSKDIKSKFETTTLNNTININSSFTLPKDVEMIINGKVETVNIKWNSSNIDTSKVGNFSFNGTSTEYDRNVIFNLTVRKPIKEKKIGFVTNIYEKAGNSYVTFDEAQFFTDTEDDKTATNEAIKDGLTADSGYFSQEGFIYNSYYIRNSSKSTKEYMISKNATYSLMDFVVNPVWHPVVSNIQVTPEEFKKYVSTWKDSLYQPSRALLFWIYTEDGIVTKIEMQYTP